MLRPDDVFDAAYEVTVRRVITPDVANRAAQVIYRWHIVKRIFRLICF